MNANAQVRIALTHVRYLLITETNRRKITTNKKVGVETGREYRFLIPKIKTAASGPARKEPEPKVPATGHGNNRGAILSCR